MGLNMPCSVHNVFCQFLYVVHVVRFRKGAKIYFKLICLCMLVFLVVFQMGAKSLSSKRERNNDGSSSQ